MAGYADVAETLGEIVRGIVARLTSRSISAKTWGWRLAGEKLNDALSNPGKDDALCAKMFPVPDLQLFNLGPLCIAKAFALKSHLESTRDQCLCCAQGR